MGFVVGAFAGVSVGLVMGLSGWVRAVLTPMFSSIYPIPKVAIFPLILLIFGLGETSKWVTNGLSVFFLVLFPTVSGVLGIPRIYLDVGKELRRAGV